MSGRASSLFAACLLAAALLGCGAREKQLYLPEASDDRVFAVVGDGGSAPGPKEAPEAGPESQSAPEAPAAKPIPGAQPAGGRSIEAHPARESYPMHSQAIELEVTNHGKDTLGYAGYFDFRRIDGDNVLPLSPRGDVEFDLTQKLLAPGETVLLTVPIDLFDEPLGPGTYRVAQLACFRDPGGLELACTEITADFVIEIPPNS